MSNNSFYGTNDAKYPLGSFMSFVEIYGMIPLGSLLYFNGNNMETVDSGLHIPNGINVSPDKRYVYVTEFGGKNVLTYERKDDSKLHFIQKLFIDTNPDNIEIDPITGDLWIGCHPRMSTIFEYHFKYMGKSIAPSQVLLIKTKKGLLTSDITEVLLDDGKFVSASSVASYYGKRVLIGTVGSQLIICDVV